MTSNDWPRDNIEQSKEPYEVAAAEASLLASVATESHEETKRVQIDRSIDKIAKLESEKRTLIEELKRLELRAKRGWTSMNRKQIFSVAMLGVIVTALVIVIPPFFIDPFVSKNLPLSTLNHEAKLVSYLREVQNYENVYLGVHGYDHKCPLDGSYQYELACPNRQVPLDEVRRRIEAGIAIFKKCGLEIDSYAFPGEYFDARALSVLADYTPTASVYSKTRLGELDMPANSSLTDPVVYFGFREYTWMWRNGVSDEQFQTAQNKLDGDKPTLLLVHVQDITNQTLGLIEHAILQVHPKIIRLDDVTFDSEVQATKQVVDLATKYDAALILAVIPASPSKGGSSSYLSNDMAKALWVMSTSLFVFPIVFMVPWALIFKSKKQKPYAWWNPHYPGVSVILPAYNEEKTIAESIERALSQRYSGSIEVIVIDDGSRDRTYETAKDYAGRYGNVRVIRLEKNQGKSHALNVGFAEAKGEISVFSDTDSVLEPEAIARMVSHFKDPEVGMVAGMIVVGNEKNLITRLQQIEYLLNQAIIRFCQSSQKNVLICPGACTAVKTDVARKVPVQDRTITEDADFTFSVWKEGWKICQEPESISYTEAPADLKSVITQRKRWLYGSLQTMAIHKWAAREGNPWVLKAWIESFLCPFAMLYLILLPSQYFLMGNSFPLFLLTYGLPPLAVLGIGGTIGVRLFNRGEKSRLVFLMPLYVVYQLLMNFLEVYLIFAFVSRRGIHLMRGGRRIHAV